MTSKPGTGSAPRALYALAMFGVHSAYAPLLALMVPRRILAIAPRDAAANASLVMLAGAVAASLAHIGAGRFSDRWRARHGNRRTPMAAGLALSVVTLGIMAWAQTIATLVAALVAFQIALNVLFAPAGALLVDHFADSAKGRAAALANLAMPLASLGTGAIAIVFPRDAAAPFVVLALMVAAAVVPLLVVWPFGPAHAAPPSAARAAGGNLPDLVHAGCARLLVQGGAAFVMTYFYLFLAHDPARAGLGAGQRIDALYGRLVLATTIGVIGATLFAGRWSDRHARRRAPMVLAACGAACGLAALAGASGWALLAGYALFQIALIAYLAIDSALVAQLLASHAHPGQTLGFMNLANTLPSILVPLAVLTWGGGTAEAIWRPGFALAAVSCLGAAALLTRIRAVR